MRGAPRWSILGLKVPLGPSPLRSKIGAFWRRRPLPAFFSRIFAEPAVATILFSTAAGIVMSFGTELALAFVKEDSVKPLSLRQLAGFLMLFGSVMLSIVAWGMQAFQDHLVTIKKDKEPPPEKRFLFGEWPRHRRIQQAAIMGLIAIVTAVLVLKLSFRPGPSPAAESPAPTPVAE